MLKTWIIVYAIVSLLCIVYNMGIKKKDLEWFIIYIGISVLTLLGVIVYNL